MVAWLSLILGASIGAGANAYLTLLAIGLYSRFGEAAPQVQEAIAPFGSYWVIAPAGAMFLVEFFADKVPALDNLWDALHTLIRPVAAIFIALTLARDTETALQLIAALGSGTIALSTHGFKAGLRGLARLNPEPATNALSSSGLSLAEDLSVAGLMALVFAFPGPALVLIGALLVVVFVVGPRLARLALFAFRATASRLLSPFSSRRRAATIGAPPQSLLALLRARRAGAIEWWNRCYLDRGFLFDYRYAWIFCLDDAIAVVHRSWLRRRIELVELGRVRGAALDRGPLAVRVVLDSGDREVRLMLLATEKRELELLLTKLASAGVPVLHGAGAVSERRPETASAS